MRSFCFKKKRAGVVGLTLGPRAGRPGHQAHAKNDGAKNVSGQQRSPSRSWGRVAPEFGDPPPRRIGGTRRGAGGWAPSPGRGVFAQGGGLGGSSRPRGRRRGKVHGSGGGGGGCRAPPRAGGGSGHGLPLLVGAPASMRGGGLERGSAGGSWRRLPAYTPGGDFSVMPLSTSSIRSSSITTAGTAGVRGRGDATASAPLPRLSPPSGSRCAPGSGAEGVRVGTVGMKGGGSRPCPAWVGAASPPQPAGCLWMGD